MRRKNVYRSAVLFTCVMMLTGLPNSLSGEPPISSEELDIENSIIIRELNMDSREDGLSENSSGQILFDDSFIQPGKTRKIKASRVVRKKSPQRHSIKYLQKKDSRWHLSRYQIRRGDNLWRIADRFDVSHRLIIQYNDFSNPDHLKPGRYIMVPNRQGVYHRIRRGDNLGTIALRYRGEVKTIRAQNNIRGSKIYSGQKLFIPDGRNPYRQIAKNKKGALKSRKGISKRTLAKTVTKPGHKPREKSSRVAFYWPIRGKITSGFGRRLDPISRQRRFHCGIDISANVGTPVRASAPGNVIFSGWKGGYGKVVIIRHHGGYITVYAHNSKNMVQKGTPVKKGSLIARSGMTGAVTGAHLHFEIRKYVTPLNPLRLLR